MTHSTTKTYQYPWRLVFTSGLALFAMFFGAGNVTFPLLLGQQAGPNYVVAITGLVVTAVLMPLLGFISMLLFKADYFEFFKRLGKIPGMFLICLGLAMIGPFAVIPRIVTVAEASLNYSGLSMPLVLFALIACTLIFILSVKPSMLIDIIGVWLTPILLLSIILLVVAGISTPSHFVSDTNFSLLPIWLGMEAGYQTLDLLGALFFAGLIYHNIEHYLKQKNEQPTTKKILSYSVASSFIGGSLLALTYAAMIYVSAKHGELNMKTAIDPEQLLVHLSHSLLGQYSGIAISILVVLACLTTAISLSAISAQFLNTISNQKISYLNGLIITLAITFCISLLGFSGLMTLIAPVVFICYPVYIVICLFNMAFKLWDIHMIKWPAVITLCISLGLLVFLN